MVNRKELQSLHREERETTPDNGVTTYRSKSAASHEESSPAGDVVESSRSARSFHFGHHHMKSGLPSPSLDTGPAAPDGLIDIISCAWKASGKACSIGDAAVRDIP